MQVIQTINDTIRILFSPIDEDFRLLDFLLVQEGENKYLAQIIEIYDDKYDASQNVARVKLFFKVNNKGEVYGYDHFTPSKECEIKKIKREEILTFINENREALTIGLDYASQEPLDINIEFLKNNAVIFADKIEHSNNICAHFATTLSRYNKHSVIFDFTGAIDIKNAKKLKITKDVKLPLNFYTINYIWEKGLKTASLETQAICREIFNEVQTYAKSAPEGFIPFNKFLKVVEIQYKATPITELTVLLNKLKGYQKNNIFANSKKDFESIEISCRENDVTIVDFSELKTSWHKEFCDFAIRSIKNAFVFIRLNETNSDVDLINFIYDKNPQINLVPSISYSYSKMPHIIERADNFILLPTLSPRRDFGAANFELSSIANDECILFGKDSENFIFTIKNDRFSNTDETDKNPPRRIRLKLDIDTNSPKERLRTDINNEIENDFEQQAKEPVLTDEELEFFEQQKEKLEALEEKILIKKSEDSSLESQSCDKPKIQTEEISKDNSAKDTEPEEEISKESFLLDSDAQEIQKEPTLEEQKPDEILADEYDNSKETLSNENIQTPQEDGCGVEDNILEEENSQEVQSEEFPQDVDYPDEPESDINKEILEGEIIEEDEQENFQKADEDSSEPLSELAKAIREDEQNVTISLDDEIQITKNYSTEEIIDIKSEQAQSIELEATSGTLEEGLEDEPKEEITQTNESLADNEEKPKEIDIAMQTSDTAKMQEESEEIQPSSFQNILSEEEYNAEEEMQDDETFSLEDLATQSVENAFNEVMDTQNNKSESLQKDLSGKLVVDENIVIDLEKIKEHVDTQGTSELPIFKNTSAKKEPKNFKTGDIIEHDKYGTGEVVKVINYANRSLLQINFKEVGKRLLDPDIANIRELKQD